MTRSLMLVALLLGAVAFTACPPRQAAPPPPPPEGDAGEPDEVCDDDRVCGEDCCEDGELCGEDGCVTPEQCDEGRTCGDTCCDDGELCIDGACGTIDLTPDATGFAESIALTARTFAEDSCEASNNCVINHGDRELLEFSVGIQNLGSRPFSLDDEGLSPACGEAAQHASLLYFEVVDSVGEVVLEGDLQPSCVAGGDGFSCDGALGLAPGASSPATLGTCPLVDATRLPMGDYTLVITVDPENLIAESDETNNTIEARFSATCRNDRSMCGGVCCPNDKCEADTCLLPDLSIDTQRMVDSVQFTTEFFPEESCALFEGCVVASGERRLLRFDTTTPNMGNADLFLGDPRENDDGTFEFSDCHNHYHFESYANYRLLDLDGNVAARGHKQAFCLIDTDRIDPAAGPPQYNCGFQGITQGWADTYNAGLDCQWVDVTGVPPGDYELEVKVNGEWFLDELDFTNNIASAVITIPEDPNQCFPSDEICGDGLDQDCDGVPDNGCPAITGIGTCENALELSNNGVFRFTGENAGPSSSSCGGAGPGGFFRLSVPTEEIVYFSTYQDDSPVDMVLTVYNNACGGTELACSDDSCGTPQSHIAREFEPGNYIIEARAKDASASGDFQLKVQRSFCAGAGAIDASGAFSGDNSIGNNEHSPVECAAGGGNAGDEMWFFTTCPGDNAVDFSTCGASFDTMLELREGVCASSAASLCIDDEDGCDPNGRGSHIDTTLSGDGLWFILVDGYNANDEGPYTLDVSLGQ